MDILISNVTVVTMNERMEVLFGACIGITDGKISLISKKVPEEKPQTIIDGTGMVAIPGLVNCHTHLATTALRCYLDELPSHEALENLLQKPLSLDEKVRRILALEAEEKNAEICDYVVKADDFAAAAKEIIDGLFGKKRKRK